MDQVRSATCSAGVMFTSGTKEGNWLELQPHRILTPWTVNRPRRPAGSPSMIPANRSAYQIRQRQDRSSAPLACNSARSASLARTLTRTGVRRSWRAVALPGLPTTCQRFKGGAVTPHRGVGRAGQCVAGRAGGCRPSIAPGRARKCSRPTLPQGAKGSTASPRRAAAGVRRGGVPRQPAVIPWVSWLVSHSHADSHLICMTGSRGRPGLLSARGCGPRLWTAPGEEIRPHDPPPGVEAGSRSGF